MADLAPGTEIAGHRIEAVAGRGGMGVVYRALQLGLERPVALKLIAQPLAEDPAFRERFVRESRAAASIDHPNVVPIYSAGEDEGVLYLAMRWVDGPDLRTLVRLGGPLEPARAARLVAAMGGALDAAHERGIVHRDVKPANVLVGPGEHAYLTDFGLTRRVGSRTGTTQAGGWVGTLGYVAPEQIRNERADARADVYALGCLLHFALTGAPPYEARTDEALLWSHLNDPPPRPSDHDAPEAFDAVVARALAKDPADRFPSAGDLGRAAVAAAGGAAPAPERRVARGAAAPGGAAVRTVVSPATAPTALAEPSERRRPAWAWALAAVPVLGLAVVAAIVLAGADPPADRARTTPPPTTAAPGPSGVAAVPGAPLRVNGRPNDVLRAGGRLWVLRSGSPRVAVLQGDALRAGPEVGTAPAALAAGFDRLWVADAQPAALRSLSLRTRRLQGAPIGLGVPGRAVDVAAGEGAVWVGVRGNPGYVVKVDPRTRAVTKTIVVAAGVQNLAVGFDAVWVSTRRGNGLVRIAVADASQQTITVGAEPKVVATGADAVWVANSEEDTVTRVDAGSLGTETIPVGRRPYGVAVGEGAVFVTNSLDDTVTRIDPEARDPLGEPVETGNNPGVIDVQGRSVYVGSPPDRTVYRLRYDPRARG